MNIGDQVLVDPLGDNRPFQGIVMGFSESKVQVDWTEKRPSFFGLLEKEVSCSSFFERKRIEAVSFTDPLRDLPEGEEELWEEVLKIGWIELQKGRWGHKDKNGKTWHVSAGLIGGSGLSPKEIEVSGTTRKEALKEALRKLRKIKEVVE